MYAAFEPAHQHYEQQNGRVGETLRTFMIVDSITVATQQSRSPSSRKTTFSSKTHKNGLVSTGLVYIKSMQKITSLFLSYHWS
jgi:hypothetical protein